MAIAINKEGLVSLDFGHHSLLGIYTFVHDTLEPHCHHFDNQLPISIYYEQKNQIAFSKKYTYDQIQTTLQHHIQETELGFIWKITRNISSDELHSCRFGITIPLGFFSIEDKNGVIPTSLINYQQQWQNKYADQTNIDLPILRLKRAESIIICTPMTDNVQFFKFTDNGVGNLKVATKTGSEVGLTLYLLPNEDNLKQAYCSVWPESKNYVYRAEVLKRKIHNKYDIRVLSHETFHRGGYTICPPSPDELEYYMELLEENLSFYPAEVFEHVGLKTISVCGYMSDDSDLIKGYSEAGGILLNASEKLSYSSKCRAIHHEMFHRIEGIVLLKFGGDKFKEHWSKLPEYDSFTEAFRETRADLDPIAQPNEYRCELFATFVLDPRFVKQLAEKDSIVRYKLEAVKSIFGRLSSECDQIAQNHDHDAENTLVSITEPPKKIQHGVILDRLLVGVKHSCLPELISAFSMPNAPIIGDVSQIPADANLAYVTISPLDFCAIEYIERQTSVEDSFAQWISIHTCLENNKSVLSLKSEDVLKFDIHAVRNFLEGMGAPFEVDYLWNVVKEIHPYHLDSIPFLKKIWKLFRNAPIIARVGYSDISCEE